MGKYYFLMCLVPPLPDNLGDTLPAGGFGAIADMAKKNINPEDVDLLHALLGVFDSLNWEQFDQGRDCFIHGGTVSLDDMLLKSNLPFFIRAFIEEKERGIHRIYPYDRLWELYYGYALEIGERYGSRFIAEFLGWEVGLRCALVTQRVRERGGDSNNHTIMPFFSSGDFSSILSQIKTKSNPLDAEKMLDEERLRQIHLSEGFSEFSVDALLAYLSRAAIFARWERIAGHFDAETYLFNGGLS
ncbi:MAG: DUF2764 domain-containing protein [Deltaproteobacteria bacterium]|nr:DUF2764 domain-containing protein [Deltaproteobacteria bacterium]